ncbi:MAG: SUMF1/EgtB/PvdO family nonheme iron enzyme [Planctomycetes bacterium]|nr:SUMF1/EgtB/PvdO family nonheme iron enzyme [Planctomycetota bacterium]
MRIIWLVGLIAVALLTRFAFWGGEVESPLEGIDFHADYELREATSAVLTKSMPSWASAFGETRLHVGTGLPTPVLDAEHDLVYVLVPPGRYPIGQNDLRAPREELPRVVWRDPDPSSRAVKVDYYDIEEPFYIGRDEVPMRCVRGRPEASLPEFFEEYPDDFPAVGMTFSEARDLAVVLGGTIPTEVEWECAARGPYLDHMWPWGSSDDRGDALIGPSEELSTLDALRPTGSSSHDESWCGARDMAGSVAEWALDEIIDTPYLRGGSCLSTIGGARTTSRALRAGERRYDFVGFRLVRRP